MQQHRRAHFSTAWRLEIKDALANCVLRHEVKALAVVLLSDQTWRQQNENVGTKQNQ